MLGFLQIVFGVVAGITARAISDFIIANIPAGTVPFDVSGLVEAFIVALAAIAFIFSVLYVAVAYGFWVGAGWSRMLAIILSILGIILGLISLPGCIIFIIIYGVILWYLMQPHVKAFFGAAPPPTPPPAPPA